MKKLGFGFMRLPQLDENDFASIDYDTLLPMVDSFMADGFVYIDTAYVYHAGHSEEAVRRAVVERYARERFVLADKLPVVALKEQADQERIFTEQLARCGVEYFDNYLLHNLGVQTWQTAQALDSFGFIARKKTEGRIRRIGFSFHDSAQLLDEILIAHPEVDFVQLQINYLDWEDASIQSRLCYETARRHQKPIVVMEPVKGGILASVPARAAALFEEKAPGMSPASWAIRYAAGLAGVEMVLSGMGNPEQLADNMGYMREFMPLNEGQLATVAEAGDIIREAVAIPCTACQYCVADCPQNIAIPKYFALYNNERLRGEGGFSLPGLYYSNYTKLYGKASACIGCRACERHCPQMLPIVQHLGEVAAQFETA